MSESKIVEKRIPGIRRPGERFQNVQYAEDIYGTLKRIWSYFSEQKAILISTFLVVVAGTLSGIFAPIKQSNAIDIIAGKSPGELKTCLSIMLIVYAVYSLCLLIQGVLSAKLSQKIVKKLREELFSKIVELPVSYIDNHSHGDIMSRMTNDIENISNTVSQSLPSLFSGFLTILGTAFVMFWYCWQLALLSFTTVLLVCFATNFLSKKVRKYSRSRSELLGNLNGTVEEMVSGYRTVVAYNQQEKIIKKFCDTSDSLTKAGIKTEIFSGVMGPVMNCIGNIGFVIIAAFGGYFSYKGLISVGVISAFIVYARQLSRPINELAQVYGQLQTAIAGAERVFYILDENSEPLDGITMKKLSKAQVEFKNVNFSYVQDKPVIKKFNLNVPFGKKIALVGSTGSGKTTIANLLMRFYDIDSGEILIDGKNIYEYTRTSLRKNIAIVLQDTVLFTDTLENNLKYANDNATDEELEQAVKLSRCKDIINAFPNGYKSVLKSSGSEISQGQKQLLAIARAFVANPSILILDEATSNVDTRTEKAIQNAMQQIMRNRTSIVIAHRLSTIRDADMIIVMDNGTIAEGGTHDELLAQKGKYYELYMTQYAGFAT